MKWLAITVSIVVLAAVVAAFMAVGSPSSQRASNFDNRRVSDLQSIQDQIVTKWERKGSLINNLSELKDGLSGYVLPNDPESNQDYEYNKKSDLSFELCANFSLASTSVDSARHVPSAPYPGDNMSQDWNHAFGHQCFERTIDPQMYKPVPR